MDYLRSFAISAAGLSADRLRLEAAALNLAHANSPQDATAPAFRPVRAVARDVAGPAFERQAADILRELPAALALLQQPVPARRVHDTAHPLADAQGYVSFPGIDHATEMVSLMTALRSYEANVAALNTARSMALKTLDIGRNT